MTTWEKWRKLYNRKIKPEARPLIILKSFGPVDYVFDISDTDEDEDEDGSSIPEEILNPFKIKGVISQIKYNRIINNLDNYGIKFVESNFGSQHAGEIKLIDAFNLNIIRSKNIYNVTFNYCM